MLLSLSQKNRTIRRFDSAKLVTDDHLEYALTCARNAASAGNLQRIRYVTVSGESAKELFSYISLGGLLPPEKKPTPDVAPTAYIVLTSASENPDANLMIDVGIAAEAITLALAEHGIGACMIRNFNKEYFSKLSGSEFAYPLLVIAIGYPVEKAQILNTNDSKALKYYKDENNINVVPKLTLDELVIRKIQ